MDVRIRRELPACQVVMLTTFDDKEYVVRALRAGAVGYLLKDLPAAELASAHAAIYARDHGLR
ncbi:MAG TPA: response regulator [Streptosporangiaceae bacterium]|nr:response regulator [Streptosporangiaceae bacterium]